MFVEYVNPKAAIDLFAGVSSLFFEKVGGIEPPATTPEPKDDLTKISGVGRVFARRLSEAGIDSYAELASYTPEYVRSVAEVRDWQGDPADWIEQAKVLADG